MKKIILAVLAVLVLAVSVNARDGKDMEMAGRVADINQEKKIFTVEDIEGQRYDFAVTPSTDFKYKDKFFNKAKFSSLAAGQWVKVDYYSGRKIHTADEVKIYKEK